MSNSKLNYIVKQAKDMNDVCFIEGLIHVCENKRTIYTAKLPEWIKNLIISSNVSNSSFKTKLYSELMIVREFIAGNNIKKEKSTIYKKHHMMENTN